MWSESDGIQCAVLLLLLLCCMHTWSVTYILEYCLTFTLCSLSIRAEVSPAPIPRRFARIFASTNAGLFTITSM